MPLKKYNEKRDFKKTAEPKGVKNKSQGALRFVVQKHAASRLHFDFRLEIDGVLVSWAVPKGPSSNPADRRLAVQTEDHPMSYTDFEGTIPKGQYGGGTVMVWDIGTYHAEGNEDVSKDNKLMKKQLADGSIKVTLNGKKLKGTWNLVMMKGEDKQWLLIKSKDEFAGEKNEFDDLSVLTQRDMNQITEGKAEKTTNKIQIPNSKTKTPSQNEGLSFIAEDLAGAVKTKTFPEDWRPMLAKLGDEAFDNEDWIFETKFDGYRAIAEIQNKTATLISRNGNKFTAYKSIQNSLEEITNDLILDGEIVIEDKQGRSRFQWLQNHADKPKQGKLKFYVFDILYFNGFDLRQLELLHRKKILKALLPKLDNIIYSEHIVGEGIKAFASEKKKDGEGIIAKRASSKYYCNKRSPDWLKIKTDKQQEMVIGGFTKPKGSRKGLGAILCGYYSGKELHYSGKVGTGFSESALIELHEKLSKLTRKTSPFTETPNEPGVQWVTPKLVAEIKFSEITENNSMRHPVYLGLREDKDPKDVTLELPQVDTEELDESEQSSKKEKTKKKKSADKSKSIGKLKKPSATEIKQFSDKASFTNTDKIFWTKEKITKGDVIAYYNSVADYILPYLKDRPQSLLRTPDGIKKKGFFQKNVAGAVPKWIKTKKIQSKSKDEPIEYLLCQDKDTLLFLTNWGCIELNPWSSRVGSINNPDYIIFDLDPKDAPIENIVKTAQKLKEVLDKIKVPGYIKTSGGNGLHVFIPVLPRYTYTQTRNFSHLVSKMVHRDLPEITSLERMPSKRKGKVYLDYLQNGKGKTMASIYSLRPREGAGVSTPLEWVEINDSLNLSDYNFFTIHERLQKKGDLWKDIFDNAVDLKQVLADL